MRQYQKFRIEIFVRAQTKLSRIGLRFKYLPAESSAWIACRDCFHWLPNIKRSGNQFTGDHNSRSPTAILSSKKSPAVSVIPDLDLLATDRPAPQYLDMGFPD
ncbi:MAG: hypothetical protein DRP62_08355, partial [Planctomycetota bacterium]